MTKEEGAKEIKKWYQDEINIHRKTGNYKYEITTSMIADAFKKGYELAKLNIKV